MEFCDLLGEDDDIHRFETDRVAAPFPGNADPGFYGSADFPGWRLTTLLFIGALVCCSGSLFATLFLPNRSYNSSLIFPCACVCGVVLVVIEGCIQ